MSDPKKDEIAKLVEQAIEGLIEEALVVGDTGYMEFDPAGARGVIAKALASQATGVCDECGEPLVPTEATWYHRECDLKRDEARAEELRSLREEREQAMKILAGGGLYRADASGELHEVPTTLLDRARMVASSAETEADIVDDIRAERESAKARAESAEAELLKVREENARLSSLQAKACSCICHEDGVAPILKFYADVNARAERDILSGKPVTGAHHRALEAEIVVYR